MACPDRPRGLPERRESAVFAESRRSNHKEHPARRSERTITDQRAEAYYETKVAHQSTGREHILIKCFYYSCVLEAAGIELYPAHCITGFDRGGGGMNMLYDLFSFF